MRRVLVVVGVALVVVGLVVGLAPVSSGGVACGSAFHRSVESWGDLTGGCASLRSVLRIPAVALLVLGVLGLAGAALSGSDGRRD